MHQFSELCPRIFKIFLLTVPLKKAFEWRPRPPAETLLTCECGRRSGSADDVSLTPTIGTQEQKANQTVCALLCSQWAYNVHDPPDPDPYQAGGTVVITSKCLTPRINSHDADPSGLGRWNEPLRCTTFLSVYRPCRQTSKGISTVQAQHRRAMHKKDLDPRRVLLEDLQVFILQQQEK
jgi:hypothetical protein